jgi:hypothetical protein
LAENTMTADRESFGMHPMIRQRMLNLNPDFIEGIRHVLAKTGFTEQGVPDRLGCEEMIRITAKEMPRLLRLTSEGTALDSLIRLLVFGAEVEVAAARQALQPMTLESWCDGGILEVRERGVSPLFSLFPHSGFLIACDRTARQLDYQIRPDHVHGPGQSSQWLLNATIKRQVRSALDLGTGCGIQGISCAAHSDKVVCTDINQRALNVASFNTALNGLENVEIRAGDLFDPVKGETFDLITMNPPFAISPETRFQFRDGGLGGDGFVQRVVREAPAYLTENGICQFTAEWAHVRGIDWQSRIEGWFHGSGCDVWLICLATRDPDIYALNWISETDKESTDKYTHRWEEWMTYYEQESIDKVGTGIITMRRRTAPRNGFWITQEIDGIDVFTGEAIERGLRLRDFLSETSAEDLLDTRLQIVPEAVIESLSRSDGDGWKMERTILRHGRGLRYAGNLDIHIARLIGQCNGRKPLRQLIDELAGSLGVESDKILDSALAAISNLIERGFVLPPNIMAG